MKIKYKVNTKGYIVLQREIIGLLKQLSFAELGAYICFVTQADWDRKHELYAAITRDDTELADAFNCDYSTVRRMRKKLISKGLLKVIDEITYVKNLAMFDISTVKAIQKRQLSNVHSNFSKSETDFNKILFEYEEMHKD